MTAPKRPIDYRDHRLVTGLLAALYDADGDFDPKELEELFRSDLWKPDTISRTLTDLVNLGAVRRVKPRGSNPRARAMLRMTGLGRAWVDRELEPYVPRHAEDEEDQVEAVETPTVD